MSIDALRLLAKLEARVEALERPVGIPGTGECVCPASPAKRLRDMQRMREPHTERFNEFNDPLLDHRCPWHGEKAQPKLWGRHKEKVLRVKFQEWESLGVDYTVQPAPPVIPAVLSGCAIRAALQQAPGPMSLGQKLSAYEDVGKLLDQCGVCDFQVVEIDPADFEVYVPDHRVSEIQTQLDLLRTPGYRLDVKPLSTYRDV